MLRLFDRYSTIEFARANCAPNEEVVFAPLKDFLRPFLIVRRAQYSMMNGENKPARRTNLR